jgi:hypothetical protein
VSTRVEDQAQRETREVAGAAPAVRDPTLVPDVRTPAGVLALQRAAGNRAVGRLLARRESWATPAQAQATATATRTRLRTQLLPYMQRHGRQIVRNTAELFTGTNPLLTMDAITKRSDSQAQVASPTAPGFVTPALYDAFFTGVTMNNVDYHQKRMIGTLSGTTMFVRGHDADGDLESLEDMANTVVHECSHFFVEQYGELPQTSQAGSFDRYADEFRAFWVEGEYGDLADAERAARIRERLVGTAGDPSSGYPALHAAYFAPGPNQFRAQVDALTGPLGYNLSNSIRLHNLWLLFREQAAGTKTVDDLIFAIARLPAAERAEAARSTLIRGLETAIGGVGARRVRAALSVPTSADYVGRINPAGSQPINVFLGAIIYGRPDLLKRCYGDLPPADRRTLTRNAAFMVFVDHHLLDSALRAAVWAMTETWQTSQFDAMVAFVDSLRRAKAEADAGTLNGVPDYVTQAIGALHDYSRWTFFSWSREGALRDYVDVLPGGVARDIRERLRA